MMASRTVKITKIHRSVRENALKTISTNEHGFVGKNLNIIYYHFFFRRMLSD